MRRISFFFLVFLILSGCSQKESIEDTEDEILSTQDVEIPSSIFTSEKQNMEIDEEELKLSIKTYLDSYEELTKVSSPFLDILYEGENLKENELEKFEKISKLTKENDENFSTYILNNSLPEGYQAETKRISRYITASNGILYGLDETLSNITDDLEKGKVPKINIGSIKSNIEVVNGREQKKIEDFLDKKGINTKAFGRET
ncbi:NDxxF motif lipoprotein [Niallia taxi]|uniref:NDxxF motif lipoprotein n=1 Tax=Niallia taxi TaxID=2499688 RepID=UPI003982435C